MTRRSCFPRRKTLDVRDGTGLNEADGIPATFQGLKDLAVRNERFKLVRRRLIFDQAMMAATLPNVIL
jgi:hypothetical protein